MRKKTCLQFNGLIEFNNDLEIWSWQWKKYFLLLSQIMMQAADCWIYFLTRSWRNLNYKRQWVMLFNDFVNFNLNKAQQTNEIIVINVPPIIIINGTSKVLHRQWQSLKWLQSKSKISWNNLQSEKSLCIRIGFQLRKWKWQIL